MLSSFFGWCLTRDLIDTSPVTIKKMPQPTRDRVLTDAEIKMFWNGCAELPIFGPMFQLLLLTGCRRTEVAAMRWDNIDFAARVWTVPRASVPGIYNRHRYSAEMGACWQQWSDHVAKITG